MAGMRVSLLVVMAVVANVHTQTSNCRTQCIPIRNCPPMLNLLAQVRAGTAPYQDLQRALCNRFIRGVPLVCCPRQNTLDTRDVVRPLPGGGRDLLPRSCGITALVDRVIGGVNAPLHAWPWIVLLRGTQLGRATWICGGALISDRYVLTAAHCVDESSGYNLLFVRIGEHTLSTNPDCFLGSCNQPVQDIQVAAEGITVHPAYRQPCSFCNDIALLRLSTPATLHTISVVPVCLPLDMRQNLGVVNGDFTGKHAWVAGWGSTASNPHTIQLPDVLQEALLPVGNRFCDIRGYPDPNMVVCAGGDLKDSCRGDSGGPLAISNPGNTRNYLLGLVSTGPGACGLNNTQGIYVNVNHYVPWILQNLRP